VFASVYYNSGVLS